MTGTIDFFRNYEFLDLTKSVTGSQIRLYERPHLTWSDFKNKLYEASWYNTLSVVATGVDVVTYLVLSMFRKAGYFLPLRAPPSDLAMPTSSSLCLDKATCLMQNIAFLYDTLRSIPQECRYRLRSNILLDQRDPLAIGSPKYLLARLALLRCFRAIFQEEDSEIPTFLPRDASFKIGQEFVNLREKEYALLQDAILKPFPNVALTPWLQSRLSIVDALAREMCRSADYLKAYTALRIELFIE